MLSELYNLVWKIYEEQSSFERSAGIFREISWDQLSLYYDEIEEIYVKVNYTYNRAEDRFYVLEKEDIALGILIAGCRGFIKGYNRCIL